MNSPQTIEGLLAEVPSQPDWSYRDYAHAVLMAVAGGPHFPVPLEETCRKLGIALYPKPFEGAFEESSCKDRTFRVLSLW